MKSLIATFTAGIDPGVCPTDATVGQVTDLLTYLQFSSDSGHHQHLWLAIAVVHRGLRPMAHPFYVALGQLIKDIVVS